MAKKIIKRKRNTDREKQVYLLTCKKKKKEEEKIKIKTNVVYFHTIPAMDVCIIRIHF